MYQICADPPKAMITSKGGHSAAELGGGYREADHALMTGATNRPYLITLPKPTKLTGGLMSVGISPAASKVEHVMKYRLPTKALTRCIFGFYYVGRDLLITSSDAVVSIGDTSWYTSRIHVTIWKQIRQLAFAKTLAVSANRIQTLMELAHPRCGPGQSFFSDSSR